MLKLPPKPPAGMLPAPSCDISMDMDPVSRQKWGTQWLQRYKTTRPCAAAWTGQQVLDCAWSMFDNIPAHARDVILSGKFNAGAALITTLNPEEFNLQQQDIVKNFVWVKSVVTHVSGGTPSNISSLMSYCV